MEMTRDNKPALLVLAVVAVGLFLFSKTSQGGKTIGEIVDSIGSTVRGIRNNNPGNIRKSADKWQGLSASQTDPAFFQFGDMVHGVRAIAVILKNYQKKYGLSSVHDIIARWAPSSENNTQAYINAVADYVGVDSSDGLDMTDNDTIFALVRGIIRQEVGLIASQLVSDATVSKGVSLS